MCVQKVVAGWSIVVVLVALITNGMVVAGETREKDQLELYAFITVGDNQVTLNLRITNRGQTPRTVPTGKPALQSSNFPTVMLRFEILTVESPGEKWRFIPSVTDLAPVTLQKDETATMSIALNGKEWIAARETGKQTITLTYIVGAEIAKRFGLWEGSLELRDSLDSLRTK